jgi:hypothetical protein
MAAPHILYDQNTSYGARLKNALRVFENGYNELIAVRGIMVQMLDGGVATSYLQTRFGFTDVAGAQAGFNELDALLAKLTVDTSVTNVKSAIAQTIQKLG